MLNGADVALVRLAQDAYFDPATDLPAGFTLVTQAALAVKTCAGETFAGGVYTNQNAAALVSIGTLRGVTTLVLAFRGSDDRQDSITALTDINSGYPLFATLVAAVDALALRQAIPQVLVTGHSIGAAMAQLYMQSHADNGTTCYMAETFGSPGVLQTPASDPRITNVQIADDPTVYLGLNRASAGAQLLATPLLALATIFAGPELFPGLTFLDVLKAIPALTADYVNRGSVVLLPDDDDDYYTDTSVLDAASAGPSEHLVSTYLLRLQALTNSTGDDQTGVAITPTTTGELVFRFFDTSNGSHFYTASAAERNQMIRTRPGMTYEGIGLNADTPQTDPNAAPVFRFLDPRSGSHFYTASTAERDGLTTRGAGLSYEGVAFYEHTTAQPNDTAVYRFFDKINGNHFYTPDQNEFATVLATRGDLVNEGVAFYTQKS